MSESPSPSDLPPHCICLWRLDTQTGVTVLARRNRLCSAHGDDTPWWAHIQAHGRTLAYGDES